MSIEIPDPPESLGDVITLHGGRVLEVHSASACAGQWCCIHNPSDHPLWNGRLNWRADRGLMERMCPHGIGHPDPDDMAHKRRVMTPAQYRAGAWGVHGCDGCCRPDGPRGAA